MKVFVTLAVLCLLQVIVGQTTKDGQPVEQHNQVGHGNKEENPQVSGHNAQVTHSNQDKQQQAVAQSQQVAQQHVAGQQQKPTVNTQQSAGQSSKGPVEIPPKVQQIVNQVSQHIPQVIAQHVANKQRMVRSVKNRQNWQDMQVNAVEQPGKCEFICDEPNVAACGYNGRCYWQFESQCHLSTYNCLNTQKIFHNVDSHKCLEAGAPKCYRGDL